MVGTFVALRPRLEQKVQAQTFNANQVGACDVTARPSKTNDCLVISAFRENGPGTTPGTGSRDEFVEIFNASALPVTVTSLSDDPSGTSQGIGIFVSAGMGYNPSPGGGPNPPPAQPGEAGIGAGQAANVASLACQIPGNTVIKGRSWVLCAGQTYTLGNLGGNGGRYDARPDFVIGGGNALGFNDIPDDAGIAFLNIGSPIVTQCLMGSLNCPTGFNYSSGGISGSAIVFDKAGFDPYGSGSPENTGPGIYPGNIYPSWAAQYCEGSIFSDANGILHSTTCLEPVGDASTIVLTAGQPCPQGPLNTTVPSGQQNPPNPLYGSGPPIAPIPPANQEPGTYFPVDAGVGGNLFIRRADGQLSNTRKCYGESGQYKIERRRDRSTDTNTAGQIYRDSWRSAPTTAEYVNGNFPPFTGNGPVGACSGNVTGGFCGNSEDFILDAPNPASFNVGLTLSGVSNVRSVLGAAGIHSCAGTAGVSTAAANNCNSVSQTNGSPPVIGNTLVVLNVFDPNCGSLLSCPGFANAERRYSQDASIAGAGNDPLGVLILRFRVTNNTITPLGGGRFRINDMSIPCGGQTYNSQAQPGAFGQLTTVGTQAARNLRGPDNSITPILTPTPTCGTSDSGDGSDGVSAATAIFKGLNQVGEYVVDSTLTQQNVWGTVIEDTSVTPAAGTFTPAPGVHSPFGAGSDSSYVLQTTTVGGLTQNIWPLFGPFTLVGNGPAGGVNNGTGSFAALNLAPGATIRVGFKLGVVKAGRSKIVFGREIFGPTPVP
jgi:hypothetical protein